MGRGPLDHLPDIGGTALGASVSSPVLPGGGGGDASGLVTVRPEAEADMLEARALGKHTVRPTVSMAKVERAAVGATQPPPQRVEGVPESGEDRPAPADTEVMPPPPPPPLCTNVRQTPGVLQVTEAQTTIQRGVASARADPKEPNAQGEAAEAAMEQAEEEAPMPREAEARESARAKAPLVAEATEAEAPRASEAEATEAGVPRIIEARVAEAGMSTVKPAAQEVETEAGQASIVPPVQGPPPS
ncbi:uncharacterized protein [Miscanthus floridulus]|uniref:uncharacterized protein n=1 Tax=Miscanthus floridulus TaxID=154761 RepID=UPI00345A4B00